MLPEDLLGDAEQGEVLGELAAVGAQRRALAAQLVATVDPGGHQVVRGEERQAVGVGLPERRLHPRRPGHLRHAPRLRAGKGGVVELAHPPGSAGLGVDGGVGGLDRDQGDPVGLDVVGMPVPAVAVIGDDNVRAEAADVGDDPAHRLVEVGPPERPRRVVGLGPGHPRVAELQEVDLGDPQDLAGPAQLGFADLLEPGTDLVLVGGVLGVEDGRHLAVGAADHRGGDTAIRAEREQPAHGDGLVVRMGVDGQQTEPGDVTHGVGHGVAGLTFTERITSPTRMVPSTSIPFTTWPKRLYDLVRVRRLSTVEMKNWEPLVWGPELAIATEPAM